MGLAALTCGVASAGAAAPEGPATVNWWVSCLTARGTCADEFIEQIHTEGEGSTLASVLLHHFS